MISLAHPTLNDLAPADFVRVAARAGYDALNFRIMPLEPNVPSANIFLDRALVDATEAALAETGIRVLDIELIRIEPDTRAADFEALFEAGQRFGARYVVAISMDGDESRTAQTFARLCDLAAPYGLDIVIEFMMRGQIQTLGATHRIVTAAGRRNAGILVDTLHFYRTGSVPADLAAIDPALLPYVQINDVANWPELQRTMPPEHAAWKKILPGEGTLPLDPLMRALPAGIPVSVEVPGPPDASLAEAEAFARRALAATRRVLDGVPAWT